MNYSPTPGRAVIKIELLPENLGGIVIPEKSRFPRVIAGHIVAITFGFVRKCNDCGWVQTSGKRCARCQGNVRVKSAKAPNHFGANPIGLRVTLESHTMVPLDERAGLYIVPVDSISGVLDEDAVFGMGKQDGAERCVHCGAAEAGTNQTMILVNGYCPRCGKNRAGDTRPETPTVNDREVSAIGRREISAA
jgi:hypothetical protein